MKEIDYRVSHLEIKFKLCVCVVLYIGPEQVAAFPQKPF